ncbi:MAG: hypothetical protein HC819_19565 [Cyclobacteriaceae bacterium]|nr:hypothetical protein [Cyclobacteriaceae bacterium]
MSYKKELKNKLLPGILAIVLLILSGAVATIYRKQDAIVQNLVDRFNRDFDGIIVIGDTDISPFASFPYIAVVIENVQVFEDKADMFAPILDVSHISLGFNFWTLIRGDIKVNLLKVENGNFDIVRYEDGTFNLARALSGKQKIKEIKEAYNIELQKIELTNLDIIKYDESTNIHAETYIKQATSKFKNARDLLMIGLQSQLILNVIDNGDSTIFKNKHIDARTELDYDKSNGLLTIQPSEFTMENGVFDIAGTMDILHELDLDLVIEGGNSNFDLLIAFAPKELIPTLESYENAGDIFFNTTITGKSLSGHRPAIEAKFGCDSAYFINPKSQKMLKEISFRGHFTNGSERNMRTMAIELNNITAKPEAGTFHANLSMSNFETPVIEMGIDADFNLDFLAKFLNVSSVKNLDGNVSLRMKFRDIVDLNEPEKSLEKLNQSYYSELIVDNLTFEIPGYPLRYDSIDIKASMDGSHASIEYLYMNMGNSDITIRGDIDNLPSIVHQTNEAIEANLFVFADLLDLRELSAYDTIHKKPIK